MAECKIHCSYTKLVDPKILKPHPSNPNKHTPAQAAMLARIIKLTGWRSVIAVSESSGYIVAGHLRHQAALVMELAKVPVDYQHFDSEEDELAHLVADNAVAEMSVLDETVLRRIARQMKKAQFDPARMGLDSVRIAKLELNPLAQKPDRKAGAPMATLTIPARAWLVQAAEIREAIDNAAEPFGITAEWPE